MKQLLSLFLFLLPCLAWAQYPSNGNQKITLGEQTTADGLIYRGVASDTTLTAKSDTAAYFVLDTANLNLYTYKASASGKKWIQLGSDTTSLNLVSRFATKLNISDTATMLTNYWRAGRFSGTLPVANGGTGQTTATAALNALLPSQNTFTQGLLLTSDGTNVSWRAEERVRDFDGNYYNVIAIGTQVWFKENLRTSKYRTGGLIPNVSVNASWAALTTGGRSYFNNDSTTYSPIYGALYNWYATNGDSICPIGWHVPTDSEWTTLSTYLGGGNVAGGKLKAIGTTYWTSPNTEATNETGFSALPNGFRDNDGTFGLLNGYATFYSTTVFSGNYIYTRYVDAGLFVRSTDFLKSIGNAIRCIKD